MNGCVLVCVLVCVGVCVLVGVLVGVPSVCWWVSLWPGVSALS